MPTNSGLINTTIVEGSEQSLQLENVADYNFEAIKHANIDIRVRNVIDEHMMQQPSHAKNGTLVGTNITRPNSIEHDDVEEAIHV